MKRFLQNQKGLTLVELLAVIVILGIVAAIAVPTVGNIIQKSRINAIKSDAIQVINAAKLYVAEYGVPNGTLGTSGATATGNSDVNLGSYIDNVTTLASYTVSVGDTGTTFEITATSAANKAGKYTVHFNGADVTEINGYTDYDIGNQDAGNAVYISE